MHLGDLAGAYHHVGEVGDVVDAGEGGIGCCICTHLLLMGGVLMVEKDVDVVQTVVMAPVEFLHECMAADIIICGDEEAGIVGRVRHTVVVSPGVGLVAVYVAADGQFEIVGDDGCGVSASVEHGG